MLLLSLPLGVFDDLGWSLVSISSTCLAHYSPAFLPWVLYAWRFLHVEFYTVSFDTLLLLPLLFYNS